MVNIHIKETKKNLECVIFYPDFSLIKAGFKVPNTDESYKILETIEKAFEVLNFREREANK